MKGIMRSATPARSDDPPPNPRRLKYILPIKLSMIFKERRHVNGGKILFLRTINQEGRRNSRETSSHGPSEEIVARKETGRVFWIGDRHIDEHALEKQINPRHI